MPSRGKTERDDISRGSMRGGCAHTMAVRFQCRRRVSGQRISLLLVDVPESIKITTKMKRKQRWVCQWIKRGQLTGISNYR